MQGLVHRGNDSMFNWINCRIATEFFHEKVSGKSSILKTLPTHENIKMTYPFQVGHFDVACFGCFEDLGSACPPVSEPVAALS